MKINEVVFRRINPSERFVQEVEALRLYPVMIHVAAADPLGASIQQLFVPHEERNFGNATNAMNALCRIADRLGVTLHLEALPDEDEPSMDRARLVAFYRRFGFERGKADGLMWRSPRSRRLHKS